MRTLALIELAAIYAAWWYPFIFRAPHIQRRPSITVAGPTRIGLLFESAAILLAFFVRVPGAPRDGVPYLLGALLLGAVSVWLGWTAVVHLGRQFRFHAGLYCDHQLVRTGPYAMVRHPIYASLLLLLLLTLLMLTPWRWAPPAIALFILGTEIRVRSEDKLLVSRFGDEFTAYRKSVPAYIPFVR